MKTSERKSLVENDKAENHAVPLSRTGRLSLKTIEKTEPPTKCEFCGSPLHPHNQTSVICPKCHVVISTTFMHPCPNAPEELPEYQQPAILSTTCFLCKQTIVEGHCSSYVVEPKGYQSGWFHAHDTCDQTVSKPFFGKSYKQYLQDADFSDAEVKAYDELETKFVHIILMLNDNTSIRKIAEQLGINRGKIWRLQKHLIELRKAQTTQK